MAQLLKQSTAYTFQLGPFVDSADGFTPKGALTIAATDVDVSKNGAAYGDKSDATALTGAGDSQGWYDCVLDATDTGTLGKLEVRCYVSGALPVWKEFMVVPAHVYDGLVAGSDNLQVDVVQLLGTAWLSPAVAGTPDVNMKQISGDATAADNAEAFFDGTGYAGTNNVIPSVTTVTGNVNGSVASVTGAVGSVTGNVGGSVAGVTGAVTVGGYAAGQDPATLIDANSTNIDTILTNLTTLTNEKVGVIKNGTGTITFPMFDSNGDMTTGLTVTGQRSIDGAALAAVSGTITELSGGLYKFVYAAADTNGDFITWKFSATGAKSLPITFVTERPS